MGFFNDRFYAFVSTLIVWAAAAFLGMVLSNQFMLSAGNGVFIMIVLLALIGAAAMATGFIWNSLRPVEIQPAEKSKSTRVQKVLRDLSDEEVEELRARLSVDGEVSLEELLDDRRSTSK